MKKQELRREISSLKELLQSIFPSSLARRIELDNQFFAKAHQFASEVLDFSYYSELEQIVNTSKIQGVIKKIDVSKNKNLIELIFPNQKLTRLNLNNNKKLVKLVINNNQLTGLNLNQNSHLEYLNVANNEITGIWEIKCSKIKFLACQNNYLNELRIHKDLRNILLNSIQNYLQPQKHDKGRINLLKNITYVTPLEDQNIYTKDDDNSEHYQSSQVITQASWKTFYRWLQIEIIEYDNLHIKLKSNQQVNYPNLSENALNRFVNSLEATLDNDSFFHLFPIYDNGLSFEELFNPSLIFCGKKTDQKRIGEVSYKDLKKLFCDWKAFLTFSQEKVSREEHFSSEIQSWPKHY